jgi:hypothetical protein
MKSEPTQVRPCGEQLRKNIDRYGEGNEELAAEAIELFCNQK